MELFADLKIKPNECLDPEKKVCSSGDIASLVKTFKKEKETKCESEYCLVKSKDFKEFARRKNISDSELKENEGNFKIEGPRNSLALLNNFHIDDTLKNWAKEFDFFFPCPFAMMDFETTKEPFSTIFIPYVYEGEYTLNLGEKEIKRKNTCFGCVINTDVSTGGGKHWTCAFVDMRDPNLVTVEYFNSVPNPPRKPINRWLEKTKKELMTPYKNFKGFPVVKSIPVVSVDHQQNDSECGVYSLYYIRRRLEGTSYKYFQGLPIHDENISEFRKYLFVDPKK